MRRTKLIQLNTRTSAALKKRLFQEQGQRCPILKMKIAYSETALDHKHKRKDQIAGPKGRGLVRGVLHLQANSFEGKVVKIYRRYGLNKFIELIPLLRNLADYLEHPPCPPYYIHPTEKEKAKKLGKREYSKIMKRYPVWFPRRKTKPKYPHKGRITKEWEMLLDKLEKERCSK